MPSDRTRQDQTSGAPGPDYLKGRRGVAGSDLGQQGLGQDFGQGFGGQGFGGGEDEPPRRSRLLPLVIAFFALAAFAGIVWYAYEWGVGEVEPEHLPVVQAPSGPIKEKPAEPGGLEVPYTDSAVLNRGSDSEQASRIESLLPPPEEPVEVPAPPAAEPEPAPEAAPASTAETTDAPATGAAAPEAGEPQPAAVAERAPEAPAEQPAAPEAPASEAGEAAGLPELPRAESAPEAPVAEPAEQASAEQPEPLAEAPADETVTAREAPEQPAAEPAGAGAEPEPTQPAAEPAPQAAQTPAAQAPAEVAPAEVAPGSWMVQLAALRQEAAARQEWQRIQGRHSALLGSMSLQLERADLGERGVYYRVQAGPLPNRATAVDLCAQLKAAGQDCIATRR